MTQEETEFNVDFVTSFDVGNLSSPLNFAFGVEFRDETYKVTAGDPASISAGPAFIFGVGSDGFQGFPLESAGSFGSESFQLHLAAARERGVEPRTLPLPGLGLDIDTPDDLRALLRGPTASPVHAFLHDSGIADRLLADREQALEDVS